MLKLVICAAKPFRRTLRSDIRKLLVIQGVRKPDFFWRTTAKVSDLVALINTSDFFDDVELWERLDAAAAILAMVREAEIRQDMHQHIEALKAWTSFGYPLLRISYTKKVYPELEQLVSERFFTARYFLEGEHRKWKSLIPR